MMSLALWLVTGCVSESMKTMSDRVFQRAAESLQNLAFEVPVR